MVERIKKEKVESFINDTFNISCLFARKIVLVRYQTNLKLPFPLRYMTKRKMVSLEEFRDIVLKEFEKGIKSLTIDIREDLEIIAKNEIEEINNGNRPKIQKMIDNSYKQLLKESQTK